MSPSSWLKVVRMAALLVVLATPLARAEADPDPEAPPIADGGSQPDSPLAELGSDDPAEGPMTDDTPPEESGDAPSDPAPPEGPDGPPPAGF